MTHFWRKTSIIIPTAYLLGAAVVWIDFAQAPPDGLANVGIALYTLPVVLLISSLTARDFPFVQGGYYRAHAAYFIPSVFVLACGLFLIVRLVERLFRRRPRPGTSATPP